MALPISDILERRYSRRGILKAAGLGLAAAALPPLAVSARAAQSSLHFAEVPRGMDATHHVPPGYHAEALLRWGDALFTAEEATFTPQRLTATSQEKRFGYNNDFIAYFPIGGSSEHGLLCINHEYPNPELMFPGGRKGAALSEAELSVEMAALGCSIVEVERTAGQWQMVKGRYNRRVTATTAMQLTGPAAGHARLQTRADPSGRRVLGTFANCAGGQTPWGTYLTCEENVDDYFLLGEYDGPEHANHRAMDIGNTPYQHWHRADARFAVQTEPNEPNRFGWVVEIDPFDPDSTPRKRTALGRFKHESAGTVLNSDGRVVIYSGDDEHFQHLYKFVSRRRYVAGETTEGLLDNGTLYTARFEDDGTVQWLPLVFGEGPLTPENGFHSQADVLIETRRAAKLLGATPMDRPEDVEVNPRSGHVFAVMTKNPLRLKADAVNRRAPNPMGYVLEMIPPGGDHAAAQFDWRLFLEGGDPAFDDFRGGEYGGLVSANGWLACPDNVGFDPAGRIWIATDGQPATIGAADALYGSDTQGDGRAIPRCFFRAPTGAEVCGPCFTPDSKTLFLAVQHPGQGSDNAAPSTRWPDFEPALPPRPAVVAITKDDGGVIGG